MECNFVVGQKVVCVNDEFPEMQKIIAARNEFELPVQDRVYEISKIHAPKGVVKLQLKEVGEPWNFRPNRFRPLITTEISVFEAMLAPRVKVDGWGLVKKSQRDSVRQYLSG